MGQEALEAIESRADAAAGRGRFGEARSLLADAARKAEPPRVGLWLKLAAMCRVTGDNPAALQAIRAALRIDPLDPTALLMQANVLQSEGRLHEAGEIFGRALANLPDSIPPLLEAPAEQARRHYAEHQARVLEALQAAVAPAVADMDRDACNSTQRFVRNVARIGKVYRSEPSHFFYPGLRERPYHDLAATSTWAGALEAATDSIAAEFEALVTNEAAELVPYVQYQPGQPLRQWAALNHSRDWTAIHLLRNGVRVETNARHCPKTLALLRDVPQPDIAGAGPNLMFSLLAPGTTIPPHTGVANTRLVCHLPLIVPDRCWFRVGAETREWSRGKLLIFDDTIEHEAHNGSDELRVVMIFDIWHPDLSDPERAAVRETIDAAGKLGLYTQ